MNHCVLVATLWICAALVVLEGAANAAPPVRARSRTIFLNRSGVTVAPGNDDAMANQTVIAKQRAALAPYSGSDTVWTDTVSCMRELFAPFNVAIVTDDPGGVMHMEAVFTNSTVAAMDPNYPNANGVGGLGPLAGDCSVVEGGMAFAFTSLLPQDGQYLCAVMGQEIAHAYGLDHEMLAADIMSYLSYNGKKTFVNQTVSCGEFEARPCGWAANQSCRPNQNSFELLRERLGPAGDQAPVISRIVPDKGEVVAPGFAITVEASDDEVVTNVMVTIDGQYIGSDSSPPFEFVAPSDLADGKHVLVASAYDPDRSSSVGVEITVSRSGAGPGGGGGGGGGGAADGGQRGGCQAADPSGAMWLVVLGAALAQRRRRSEEGARRYGAGR